jgi:hypothetical protein
MQPERDRPDESRDSGGAAAITPEMVKAGERAVETWLDKRGFFEGCSGDIFNQELPIFVFKEMERARTMGTLLMENAR